MKNRHIRTNATGVSRHAVLLLGFFLIAGLGLAACGGGSSNNASPSGASAPSVSGGAGTFGANGASTSMFAQFRTCLQQHGATLPVGRPSGASFGAGAHGGGKGRPPKSFGTSSGSATSGTRPAGGFSRSTSPALKKAMLACAKYRPVGRPGGSTTPSSTSTVPAS